MRLEIAGAGLVTAVGHSLPQTAASLRCGVSRFRQTHVVGGRGDHIVAACVLPVSKGISGAERGMQLAHPAMAECLAAAEAAGVALGRMALLTCTAAREPAHWAGPPLSELALLRELDAAWAGLHDGLQVQQLAQAHGIDVSAPLCQQVIGGHAAGAEALSHAAELLSTGAADTCLFVGVDSGCEAASLEWLDLLDVLWMPAYRTRPVPGEAAAALLLRAVSNESDVAIEGWGDGSDSPAADSQCLGSGLTAALDQALSRWGGERQRVRCVFSDANGQRERAAQWHAAATRCLWRHGASLRLVHPADCLGDVGTATMAVQLALAAEQTTREPNEQAAIVVTGTPGERHAAAVLSRQAAEVEP